MFEAMFAAAKPTLKMLGRYALTAGLTSLVASGAIPESAVPLIDKFVVELVLLGIASIPPIYATWKQKV